MPQVTQRDVHARLREVLEHGLIGSTPLPQITP